MKKIKRIIKLADKELSHEERKALEKELYKDPRLMKEYLTYLEMNEFLEEKFAPKDIQEKGQLMEYQKESSEKKSLEAEKEALNKGIFRGSIDLVEEINTKNTGREYTGDLQEFVSIGLKENKVKEKSKRRILLVNRWYLVAASIVLLIAVSVVLNKYVFSSINPSELFATYYKPYYFVTDQTRSSDPILDSMMHKTTELYKSGDYTEALKASVNVLGINDKHIKAHFIYGLTLIEAKNFNKATEEFKFMLSNYDSYKIEAKWYLALCYLELDRPKNAKKLLQELSLSKNLYQKQALELLKKMS